ncbi:uncharacterized protein VTP21DRAFT_11646 [Calcarisporiella thermophila]|uniref:uncharacterized protein n=1 Tax=Calcarisporiella thermophila TaxID=911321 RepID=UPI003742F4A3
MSLPFTRFQSSDDQGMMDDSFNMCCTLTRTQRFYGFGICFFLGLVISILSTIFLTFLNIAGFAVLYTLGNILSLVSTGFIVGFLKQLKTMFAPVRVVASVVYLGVLVATLVVAFTLQNAILVIILVIIQFVALVWYIASYIPYGRDILRKMFGSCISSL